MKPSIDFPNIAQSEKEKKQIADFWEEHDKSTPKETFKAIFFPTIALIIAIAGIVLIIRALDPPAKTPERILQAIDDLPPAFWTMFVLACIVSVVIFYRGRKDRKKPHQDY